MTPDMQQLAERVERIETRADNIEEKFMVEVRSIHEKLNSIAVQAASRRECPQPGLCLILQGRILQIETDSRELSRELVKLQRWQSGIVAALVLIGSMITLFGPIIRAKLGISQ